MIDWWGPILLEYYAGTEGNGSTVIRSHEWLERPGSVGRATHGGSWPAPGKERFTGGSPRYQLYATSDDRYVAVAAIEDRHWENLCERLELEDELRDDASAVRFRKRTIHETSRLPLARLLREINGWHDDHASGGAYGGRSFF